jgi:hypothetical protein
MCRLLSRLSYANVVATLALFLALSTGGAWAASTLISGSKIKRGTITGKQVKDGSLTGVDLAKGSVTADRLSAGVLTQGAKGDAGAKGDIGQKGDTGSKGDPGAPGPSVAGYAVSRPSFASTLPSDSSYGATVTLNTGTSKTGPISVSFPARLIITGTTRMQNGNGSGRTMRCRLVLNPGASQQVVSADAPESVATLEEHTSTVTGAVDVAPGTYNVGMECATQTNNSNGLFADVSLTVVAVGR